MYKIYAHAAAAVVIALVEFSGQFTELPSKQSVAVLQLLCCSKQSESLSLQRHVRGQ